MGCSSSKPRPRPQPDSKFESDAEKEERCLKAMVLESNTLNLQSITLRQMELLYRYSSDFTNNTSAEMRAAMSKSGDAVRHDMAPRYYWTTLSRWLQEEEPSGARWDMDNAPASLGLESICVLNDLDYEYMLNSIHSYATHSNVAYAGLKKYMKRNAASEMARALFNDEIELDLLCPVEIAEYKEELRGVIADLQTRWFNLNDSPDDPREWDRTRELQREIANVGGKTPEDEPSEAQIRATIRMCLSRSQSHI